MYHSGVREGGYKVISESYSGHSRVIKGSYSGHIEVLRKVM